MNDPNRRKSRNVLTSAAVLALSAVALAGCGSKSSSKESNVITSCDVVAARPELVVNPAEVLAAYTVSGQELITAYISQPPENSNETPSELQRGFQIKVAARQLVEFDSSGDLTPESFLAGSASELFCTIPANPAQPDGQEKIVLSEEAIIARAVLTKVGFPPNLKGLVYTPKK